MNKSTDPESVVREIKRKTREYQSDDRLRSVSRAINQLRVVGNRSPLD
jgi:hypothetical protein